VKSLSGKLETAQRQLSQRTADAELANQQSTLTTAQAQHQITGYGTGTQFMWSEPGHSCQHHCSSLAVGELFAFIAEPSKDPDFATRPKELT